MDLKTDYEKLYQQWAKEFQQLELTKLDQELFNNYKEKVSFIDNYNEEKKEDQKHQILESYKDNFNYLFSDLLKIREQKIINAALALKEIDYNNVIESEKLFYQNLISSVKGYKKVKAVSIYEEADGIDIIKPIETKPDKIIEFEKAGIPITEEKSVIKESPITKQEEKFDYILIRFLKETPPLVGIDLINYGPFEKEDIAYIPSQNAIILINEKFAEKIEIS